MDGANLRSHITAEAAWHEFAHGSPRRQPRQSAPRVYIGSLYYVKTKLKRLPTLFLPWLRTATNAQLLDALQTQQWLLTAKQSLLAWAQAERNKWWWDRTFTIAGLDADIARTLREMRLLQEQIARINAEMQRRAAGGS